MSVRISVLAVAASSALAAQQVDSSRFAASVALYARGMEAAQSQNFALAEARFDSLIALEPRNSMAHFQRGMMRFNLRDTAAARADLRRSSELGNPQAEFYLSGPGSDMLWKPYVPDSVRVEIPEPATAPATPPVETREASAWSRELLWFAGVAGTLAILMMAWVQLTPAGQVHHDELETDETLLWFGAPARVYAFGPLEVARSVFGLIWLAMIYFGMGFRLQQFGTHMFNWFLLPFFAIGMWTLVSGYFKGARERKRTTYMLTEKRLLIARGSYLIERKLAELGRVEVYAHADGTASLSAPENKMFIERVADGASVKRLIDEAQRSAKR